MVHIFRYLSTAWSAIQGKPASYPPAAHTHGLEEVAGLEDALESKADAGHVHDASALTSGVLDVARIPVLPSQNQVVSSGGIASLSSGQQADIAKGSIVTTTDGRRWVYAGPGPKTSEVSYVELADITPEWGVIANKPSTFAPATHSHAQSEVTSLVSDLAGKQAASSMLTRMAAAPVALTSGSTVNTDASQGCLFDLTQAHNVTLADPSGALNGQRVLWRLKQDGTGGRTLTLGSKFRVPSSASALTPVTTAGKMNLLAVIYNQGEDKYDVVSFVPGY